MIIKMFFPYWLWNVMWGLSFIFTQNPISLIVATIALIGGYFWKEEAGAP